MSSLNKFGEWFIRKFPPQDKQPLKKRIVCSIFDWLLAVGFYLTLTAIIFAFYSIPVVNVFYVVLAAFGVTAVTSPFKGLALQRLLDSNN